MTRMATILMIIDVNMESHRDANNKEDDGDKDYDEEDDDRVKYDDDVQFDFDSNKKKLV